MNIFQDLVEELKEENLLEETVIELHKEKKQLEDLSQKQSIANSEMQSSASPNNDLNDVLNEFKDILQDEDKSSVSLPQNSDYGEISESETVFDATTPQIFENQIPENAPIAPTPNNQAEFYTNRATEEVSGLQLVEHVFSGVEREQMKTVPKPFDDLECKKALHAFMQVSGDMNSPEHAKAEFRLMQETESWYSALSRRDRNISVTHLRRYCETTRPSLSSTALISLARFYRNSPFSEQVRSKFDLIVTRLMTKEVSNDKRQLPFKRDEIIGHLNTLYSQWASIPLYTASDDESEILLIALKFEEFMVEAESAENFDQLINNDFFNRLRGLKESTNENFFAPLITAAAIECNVRVGNRYVDLIQAEKEKFEKNILEDKYGFLHDQAISESSSKTLQLVQLLADKIETEEPENEVVENVEPIKTEQKVRKSVKPIEEKQVNSLFKVNKWLLAATILVVVVNVGLYIWMSVSNKEEPNQQPVERVNLENSSLRDYIREARIGNHIFFGVVNPNWKTLEQEKQEEILKKIYNTASEKGFNKVHLLNGDGRTVGYMDAKGLEVY